jgi:hypothetical protein
LEAEIAAGNAMDKLKEVQKYQFWILLAVALILPLVGWSMARSGFVADTETRTKKLTETQGKLKNDPGDPNQDWKKGIEAINGEQSQQKKFAWRYLWEQQSKLMTWPAKMHPGANPDIPADPDKIQPGQQEYWRTAYEKFVAEVRLKVNPIDDDNPNGLIVYPPELLPIPEWVGGVRAPSVAQIIASQEDLWLLESLLTAIATVNSGSPAFYDAPIREIEVLYLRGGSTKGAGGGGGASKSSGGGGSTGGGVGGKVDMASMANLDMSKASINQGSGMMEQGGFGGGGSAGVSITSAKINADDDLGVEQAAKAAKGEKSSDSKTGNSMAMVSFGSNSTKGSWSGSDKNRYRDEKPEWMTRGFHLEVVMDHRHVPELLTALSNASWPMTVLRIQMSDYRDEDLAVVGSGTSGMGGSARGGMSGMSSMRGMPMGAAGGSSGPIGSKSSAPTRRPAAARGEDDDSFADSLPSDSQQNNRSALDDPNLAHVAVVGLIYIIKKPPEEKTPSSSGPSPVTTTSTPPASASPAAPADATAADAAAADPAGAAADQPADEPAGETEKPEDGDKPSADGKNEPAGDSAKPGEAAPEPGKT